MVLDLTPLQPLIFVLSFSLSPSSFLFPLSFFFPSSLIPPDITSSPRQSAYVPPRNVRLFIHGSYFVSTSLGNPEGGARVPRPKRVDPLDWWPCEACYADQTRLESKLPLPFSTRRALFIFVGTRRDQTIQERRRNRLMPRRSGDLAPPCTSRWFHPFSSCLIVL